MPSATDTNDHRTLDSKGKSKGSELDVRDSIPSLSREVLIRRVEHLKPWRMSIQITDDVNTGDYLSLTGNGADCQKNRHKARQQFLKLIDTLFPAGMINKRFLDCGCNSGGYCFWARERKAEICFGFDAREHWIKQARFVKNRRTVFPCSRMQFELLNLYDIGKENLDPFDLVQFKGLFYHLPDPIGGLKLAADLSRDVLLFASAFAIGQPDGSLVSEHCESELLHGGFGSLKWLPTGPQVCIDIIKNLGFEDVKLTKFKRVNSRSDRGRLEIVAARDKNRLSAVESVSAMLDGS